MRTLRKSHGFVYVMTVAICMLIMAIGMTYMYLIKSEAKIRDNYLMTVKMHAYGNAGVEHILGQLRQSGNLDTAFNISAPLDGGSNNYYAQYDPGTRMIKSQVYAGGNLIDRVAVKINESGFTAAVMAGQLIQFSGSLPSFEGMINGNVRAYSISVDTRNLSYLTVVGTVDASGSFYTACIPDIDHGTDLTNSLYKSYASIIVGSSTSFDVTDEMTDSYFVQGDIDIVASQLSITGFLLATGNITLRHTADNFTLNAERNNRYPALIAGGHIIIGETGFTPVTDVTINGLVYSRGSIFVQGAQNLVINGALVARGGISFDSNTNPITNMQISYDPDLRPFNFSGGQSGQSWIKIVSWKEQ